MKTLEQLQFDNTYARLPEIFYHRVATAPLTNQHLINFNHSAAGLINLDTSESTRTDFVDLISGKKLLPGFEPLAMCYAGHQFGHYVPRLGDGRAILLGQVVTDDGTKWDLQLKGAGQTLYSRNADGRAVLRSTIREYLCSEAMHGLGIPSSRALCIVGSDTEVYRETIETGALLLRMAPSHVRFGSFEYFYYNQQFDDLKKLADYVIAQHYPDLLESSSPYLLLLQHVIKSTAELIAKWQSVGFSHGVMNTDNMSIHGITLDYGPFGFLDHYQQGYICNHSDLEGRYAFDKQPDIGLFNVSCFAQALLPLLDEVPEKAAEIAMTELEKYKLIYIEHYSELMRDKLGLTEPLKQDQKLCSDLFELMQSNNVDHTILFRSLSETNVEHVRDLFFNRKEFDNWLQQYQARLAIENIDPAVRSSNMKKANPKFILRNHLAEIAIQKATQDKDYSEIETLLTLLQQPFEEHAGFESYAAQPPDWAKEIEVSCSS